MPFDISIPLVQRDMQGILSWIWSLALSKWTERSIVLGQFNEDQQCQLPSVPRLSYTGQGIFKPCFFWCFPIGQDLRSKHTLPGGSMSPQAPVELELSFYIEKDELFKQ